MSSPKQKHGALTEFIRSCPATMKGPAVVAEGALRGLVLSRSMVNLVRRNDLRKQLIPKGKPNASALLALREAARVLGVARAKRALRAFEIELQNSALRRKAGWLSTRVR